MSDIRTWRLDFDSLVPDRKAQNDPPGYDASSTKDPIVSLSGAKKKDQNTLARKQSALYAKATAPLKQVGMMCFMAWMFGNSIQIFSIIMTLSLVAQPLSAIISSGEAFPRDEDLKQLDVITPRLLYCLVFAGQFIFGLWKLNGMGLLPVYASDWISVMAVPESLEHSYAAVS